ncbi:MAG: FG-GAP-like repeat-containing protein, partial [Bryobacteraceae bacterium]
MNTRIASGVLCLLTALLRTFLNAAPSTRRSSIFGTNRQRFATPLGFLCLLAALPLSAQYNISTLAGNGNAGYGGDNGPAAEALLNKPHGIAVDSAGNVYIADQLTNRVRKVDRQGNITTVAGGSASAAAKGVQLNSPVSVAVDASGNLYIADQLSNTVRMIDAKGNLSTVAGGGSEHIRARGVATDALLNGPAGIAVDATGRLLIAESGNHAVTAVSESGRISTISDQVNDARAVAVDAAGNIYVADTSKSRILKIDMTGVVTTVAGNGKAGFEGDGGAAADAQLSNPQGVAVDAAGNLYIADTGNNRIRKVSLSGVITTIAGTGASGFSGDGGLAAAAQLSAPTGIAVDGAGNLYVADAGNQRVRQLSLIVSTDFDRNGVPDLVWQNDVSSQVSVHYYGGAGGASQIGWAWLAQTGTPGWHVVAVADFNGDGIPDLVWQNDTTRQVVVHYYGGTGGATYMGWNWLNQAGMPGWHVAGAADFNGDGVPDLVWQNDTTRAVSVNYYGGAGGAILQSTAWLNQTGAPGWSVAAIADFNGDGVPDLVWQNDATSAANVHYYGGIGGTTDQSWKWLNQAGVAGWHIKLAADFNGDGYPDLVWQSDTTRQVVVHYYGGTGGATYLTWNWLNQGSVPGWTVFSELPSTLSDNNIILPTSVSVGYGQSTPFAVKLSSPAPTNGVTITLSSSNTAFL